jgi:hypothetical protein
VERAAEAARRWEEQLGRDEGAGAWLMVSDVDPLNPAEQWLADLVTLERRWLARLRLTSAVIACEIMNKRTTRVFLEVDGPGALFYLGMEAGVHRLAPARGPARKVRIDALCRRADATPRSTSSLRMRTGPFGLNITRSLRAEVPGHPLKIELYGADRDTLSQLAADLERAPLEVLTAPVGVARIYGEGGSGAHDPRTDARVKLLKDALKGKLDPLLEAWRERARTSVSAP